MTLTWRRWTVVAAGLAALAVAAIAVVNMISGMVEAGRRTNYFAREALRQADAHIEAGEYVQAAEAQVRANLMAADHTWRLTLIRPVMRRVIRPMAGRRDYAAAIHLCNSLATFERYNSPEGTGTYYQCRVIDEDRYSFEACQADCSPVYCTQVYGMTCP